MVTVVWNKQAQNEWRHYLLYGLSEFGKTTAINYVKRTNSIIENIKKYPEAGFPEPLLKHKNKTYRAYLLVGPLKIIYYYVDSSDTIRIIDVWDMRREPKRLINRIKTK